MFNEGKQYSGKHRYEIHPSKTNIVDLVNGCKVNGDMTWNLGDNVFYFILSSEINVYQKWIKVIFSLQN